jgi:hypothetical protein
MRELIQLSEFINVKTHNIFNITSIFGRVWNLPLHINFFRCDEYEIIYTKNMPCLNRLLYDKGNCILKFFCEKYNGDYFNPSINGLESRGCLCFMDKAFFRGGISNHFPHPRCIQ